jgi:adenosylhomocysteine nucleosidase
MKVGIVATLPREAGLLLPKATKPLQAYSFGAGWLAVAGAGAENATRASERLLANGATALLTWGLAGGLKPGLPAGTVLLPASIDREAASDPATKKAVVDKHWHKFLLGRLQAEFPVCCEPLVQTDFPISSVSDKLSLFQRSGACGVDTESAAVGRVARQAKTPFAVLRVVADAATGCSPQAWQRAVDIHGRLDSAVLLTGLLKRPQDLALFFGFMRDSRRGMAALKLLAEILRAELAGWT